MMWVCERLHHSDYLLARARTEGLATLDLHKSDGGVQIDRGVISLRQLDSDCFGPTFARPRQHGSDEFFSDACAPG
jgi:hypothetical protein